MPAPIPLDAPVTTATLPVNLLIGFLLPCIPFVLTTVFGWNRPENDSEGLKKLKLAMARETPATHVRSCLHMRLVCVCGFFASAMLFASDAYPPPRFTDPERVRKLESALPEIDK